MMDSDEGNGCVPINHEQSLGCLKVQIAHGTSQKICNSGEGSSQLINEINAHPNGFPIYWEPSLNVNQGVRVRPIPWPNFHPNVQTLQQIQSSSSENQFYPINREDIMPFGKEIHRLPFKMFSQDYTHEIQYQNFEYFLVIDFEATCEKDQKLKPQEIIEFPCVLVSGFTGELESCFQTYVRPIHHQLLTDYCKELTGIQQIQVDQGISLSDALTMHDIWLQNKGVKHKNFAVVTWGDWDCCVMLETECRLKNIRKPPYFNRWINLKVPFKELYGSVRNNLKEAVQHAGLVWEGRHHSGIDDAQNTARLLCHIMRRGYRLSITNSLAPSDPRSPTQPTNQPKNDTYCFCGVKSSKCVVRKPGPTKGRLFYGCGNWTPARGAVCDYTVWAPSTE